MNHKITSYVVASAIIGALAPGVFYCLKQTWHLDVLNYPRYEALLLVFWPSSFLLLPFERVTWVGILISTLMNSFIYSVLATFIGAYLRWRTLSWLVLPGLYLIYCIAVFR